LYYCSILSYSRVIGIFNFIICYNHWTLGIMLHSCKCSTAVTPITGLFFGIAHVCSPCMTVLRLMFPLGTLQQRSATPFKLYPLESFRIIVHAKEHHMLPLHPTSPLQSFYLAFKIHCSWMINCTQCHSMGRVIFWDWPSRKPCKPTIECSSCRSYWQSAPCFQ
jgi:hypothetical protein